MKLGDVVTDEEYNQVHDGEDEQDEEDETGDSPAPVLLTHEQIDQENMSVDGVKLENIDRHLLILDEIFCLKLNSFPLCNGLKKRF